MPDVSEVRRFVTETPALPRSIHGLDLGGLLQGSRRLLEALPAAIYVTDAEGTITYCNQAAIDLAGRTPAIGKDKWCVSWRLYRPDGTPLPHEECPMAVALREQRPVRDEEIVAERPDGSRAWIMPFPTPLRDESGRFFGAVNMLVDITELKRAEASAIRRLHEQDALFGFTERLYRAASLEEFCEAAIWAITHALKADRAAVLLLDTAGVMRFVASRGLSAAYCRAVEGHSPWSLNDPDPQPICLDDVETADQPEPLKAVIRDEGIGALSFTPLVVGRSLVGKFMTYYDRPHDFSREEIDLALTIARQLGFGIERRRTEEERAQLAAIVQSSDDAIVSKDLNGIITSWNSGAERVFGYSAEEVIGRPVTILIPEGRLDEEQQILDRIRRGERVKPYETIRRRMDGALIDIYLTVSPVRDVDGRITGASKIARDITARKRMEQRLQIALDAAKMGAWEWDIVSGRVIWSPSLEAIHGLAPGSFGGTFEAFQREIHPDDRDAVLARIRQELETAQDHYLVYRICRPDGAVRWVEAFGRFSRDADGRARALAGVCMDITERKLAEEQHKLLLHELNHRVKNTLATVQSLGMQTLRSTPSSADALPVFEARLTALSRAHDVLTGQRWEGASLREIADRTLEPFQTASPRISVTGPEVRLSPKQALALSMAMHELATNAAKYGALFNDEGRVRVEWTVSSGDGAGRVVLVWQEEGGPRVTPPRRKGFGTRMIERNLAGELDGEVRLDYLAEGLVCTIETPLRHDGQPVAGEQLRSRM